MNEHFSIGCVGRLFPTKGHQYLVEAVADLSNHIPNVRLFVAGSGDPELVLSPARRLGIEDRIVLVGFRSDVSAFMRAVDVVVHASLTEAFCQTIIEALAAGAPLVVTDVAGAPEVVQDGMNGLLVRPRDSVGLVTAIRSLHESPLTRAALAGKAAQSVRDRFTIDQMIAGQLATYERVLYRAA